MQPRHRAWRSVLEQRRSNGFQLAIGLCPACIRFQSSRNSVIGAAAFAAGARLERRPKIGWNIGMEALWHHADDGVRFAFQQQALSHRSWIFLEDLLPK